MYAYISYMLVHEYTDMNVQKMESLLSYKLIFPQDLIMKLFKHTEELEELYNEYPYTHHLGCFNMSLYVALSLICPSIELCFVGFKVADMSIS